MLQQIMYWIKDGDEKLVTNFSYHIAWVLVGNLRCTKVPSLTVHLLLIPENDTVLLILMFLFIIVRLSAL